MLSLRARASLSALIVLVGMTAAALVAFAAASPARSFTYSAHADGSTVEITFMVPGVSGNNLIDARYPHAQADLGSPTQSHSRASVMDPGDLVQTIPGQADSKCRQYQQKYGFPPSCPPFPAYPYFAQADYPSKPSDSGAVKMQTIGPLTLGAGTYSARALAASAIADGAGHSLDLAGAIGVGDGTTHSITTVDDSGAAGTVTSTLSGIGLFSVVDIAGLASTARASAPAAGNGHANGALKLTGVTVLGTPATINADGVHLLGQSAAIGGATSPAQQALDQLRGAGVTIKLLPASSSVEAGLVSYEGQALQVSGVIPGGGPSFAVKIGHVAAAAFLLPEQHLTGSGGSFRSGPATTTVTIPGTSGQPAVPGTAGSPRPIQGTVRHVPDSPLAALGLAPPALLISLFGVFEAAMITAVAALLWPSRQPLPVETLRPL
jgi:hypothetical protein